MANSSSGGSSIVITAAPITASVILPSRVYAIVGKETNIYWKNIIVSNVPVDYLDIDVTCTKGAQFQKFFRYTPIAGDEASTYTITIDVYYNNVLLTTATSTIYVAGTSSGSGISRKALGIGDSTLAGGSPLAIIPTENPSDVYTLTFVGTQGTNPTKQEGRSGWRVLDFVSSGSPFYISGALNFGQYLTNNSITMASGDWVFIHLGINDVFGATTTALQDTVVTNLRALITNIQSAVSGIRVAICIPICPAASQDAFGDDYFNGQTLWQYLIWMRLWQNRLIAEFDNNTERTANRWLIPYIAIIDRENNFPVAAGNINARNTTQMNYYNNGVHPATAGYNQMGDQLWAFFKYQQ